MKLRELLDYAKKNKIKAIQFELPGNNGDMLKCQLDTPNNGFFMEIAGALGYVPVDDWVELCGDTYDVKIIENAVFIRHSWVKPKAKTEK